MKHANDEPPTGRQREEHLTCRLGRELGDCTLRRNGGCETLYDALMHVLPPWHVRQYIAVMMGGDPDAQAWLARLEDISGPEKHTWPHGMT